MVEIKEIARRVESWLNGRPRNPYKVDFFITERCNLKCRFCNFPLLNESRYKKELTRVEILSVIDYCGENDVEIVGILGGEPFVRKNVLLEVMRRIKEYGMTGSIVSNGTLLDKEAIMNLVKIGWDLIRFSLDGMQATHDFLRNKRGTFKTLVNTIKKLNKAKKNLRTKKPTIEINTVLCNKNYNELPDIIKLASSLSCNHVYILPMIEFTEYSRKLRILNEDLDEVKKYLWKAKEISTKLNLSTNINEIIGQELITKSNRMDEIILPKEKVEDKNYIPCFLPWYTMNIDAVGNVMPCCNISSLEENMRNKSLEKIWLGKEFDEMRKRMLEKNLSEECSRCCLPLTDENRNLRRIIGEKWKKK
ncbi:MAG: radical SAM protein [Candidatus Aenigmarchaeota archaeon]|nr:radical SAM protein [Candidatus Aenigmarchaeota archaeon]